MKDKKQHEKSPKKTEKFTTKEIKRLMGMDKQVYTRRRGAIRNK